MSPELDPSIVHCPWRGGQGPARGPGPRLLRRGGEDVRGVNARMANHRSCWYKPFLACFVIGAAVFGGMMGAFYEEPRIRCKGRVHASGEDPRRPVLHVLKSCGQEMKAG